MTTSEDIDSKDGILRTTTFSGVSDDFEMLIKDKPFQSIHRRNLNRISEDAVHNTKYAVPDNNDDTTKATEWFSKTKERVRETYASRTFGEWVGAIIPSYIWLRAYNWRALLLTDVLAGLAVGVMVVPQGMSYAKLAGLPVEYGLYSALFPVWAYALFGSSRQLAIGPVALVSLLLATGLEQQMERLGISSDDTLYDTTYATLAIQTSFLVGLMNIGMGIVRLGFVTIFLSHAMVSGFTTGAACLIGFSQLKNILGVNAKGDVLQEILKNIIKDIGSFNYKTFLMGTSCVLVLLFLKSVSKKYPKIKWVRALGPLLVTAVTIAMAWIFDLEEKGIPVVSKIPRGFPDFTVGLWTPIQGFGGVFTLAVSITIIGFMESIAIAKQMAAKNKYEIDSSTELIGLGVANLVGAMFQAYPVTGSFSRSAVNNEAGAQSGVSGLVTATLVGFVLLFLTSVFEKMPLCVLSAIVISGVINLLDYEEAIYLWRVHIFDFLVWMIACMGTLFLGVEIGLVIAVGVSLLLIIYESAYPHTAVLGRLPGTTVYRNVKQYPKAEKYDGIVMVRIDAPIYFANTDNVRHKLHKYEQVAAEDLAARNAGEVRYVILELSPVSHIDTSGLHILHDMIEMYKARGIQLLLSNPSVTVMEVLVKSRVADDMGREHIFVTLHDAVNWCLDEMDTAAVSVHGETMEKDLEVQGIAQSEFSVEA